MNTRNINRLRYREQTNDSQWREVGEGQNRQRGLRGRDSWVQNE